MDLSSSVINLLLRARAFESKELDVLAERMGVLQVLNADPKRRYFLARSGIVDTFLNRVIVGESYWKMLTVDQQTAIAGHEFIHLRERDSRWKVTHIGVPSILAATAAFAFSYASYHVILLSAILATFEWMIGLFVIYVLNFPESRAMELRCDMEAAKYVDPTSLIKALETADSLFGADVKKSLTYRLFSRSYPTLADRVRAVRAVENFDEIGLFNWRKDNLQGDKKETE